VTERDITIFTAVRGGPLGGGQRARDPVLRNRDNMPRCHPEGPSWNGHRAAAGPATHSVPNPLRRPGTSTSPGEVPGGGGRRTRICFLDAADDARPPLRGQTAQNHPLGSGGRCRGIARKGALLEPLRPRLDLVVDTPTSTSTSCGIRLRDVFAAVPADKGAAGHIVSAASSTASADVHFVFACRFIPQSPLGGSLRPRGGPNNKVSDSHEEPETR